MGRPQKYRTSAERLTARRASKNKYQQRVRHQVASQKKKANHASIAGDPPLSLQISSRPVQDSVNNNEPVPILHDSGAITISNESCTHPTYSSASTCNDPGCPHTPSFENILKLSSVLTVHSTSPTTSRALEANSPRVVLPDPSWTSFEDPENLISTHIAEHFVSPEQTTIIEELAASDSDHEESLSRGTQHKYSPLIGHFPSVSQSSHILPPSHVNSAPSSITPEGPLQSLNGLLLALDDVVPGEQSMPLHLHDGVPEPGGYSNVPVTPVSPTPAPFSLSELPPSSPSPQEPSLCPPDLPSQHEHQHAISSLRSSFHCICSCAGHTLPKGFTLNEITDALSTCLPRFVGNEAMSLQPLSLPRVLTHYTRGEPFYQWATPLAGSGLFPNASNGPPILDLDLTEHNYLLEKPLARNLIQTFDVDSYIFNPSSLGVFRHDVQMSFLPPFTRGRQRNQRISFPLINLTQDKCLLFCQDDRSECHVFFPHMPSSYTNPQGYLVKSQTQHLDDYALSVWMDSIVLRALDVVMEHSNRENYPKSFQNVLAIGSVKNETLQKETSSRIDVRLSIPSTLLAPIWENIVLLASDIQASSFPRDAFSDPRLVVSAHNTKLTSLGWNHTAFGEMRSTFWQDYLDRWDELYISPHTFWLDIGQKTRSICPGTSMIRKTQCNEAWADRFRCPKSHKGIKSILYPWAGTLGSSITVELGQRNELREAGIAYNKAYNVIKEQFYTPLKGHAPFSNELFEVFAYSKPQLESWAVGRGAGGLSNSFSRDDLIRQWEKTKARIHSALSDPREEDSVYSDRQEFRISLQLFLRIPEEQGHLPLNERDQRSSHYPFWILPSKSINRFRAAECNRWIACMEQIILTSSYDVNTKRYLPVIQQERNSLMSTAIARTLRLSLGCLNPLQLPSIWLGKRWSRGRTFGHANNNTNQRSNRTLYRRQGLEYKDSIRRYGMIWIPERLVDWYHPVPIFRVSKYPYLDIRFNILQQNSRKIQLSSVKSSEGQFREFFTRFIKATAQKAAQLHQARYEALIAKITPTERNRAQIPQQSFTDSHWRAAFVVAAQLVVREYNIYVLGIIQRRWCQQEGIKSHKAQAATTQFHKTARLSTSARAGTEVLCYKQLSRYLRRLGVSRVLDARQQESNSTFQDWKDGSWSGRVRPLFNPTAESPKWLHSLPHIRKLKEIEQVMQSVVPMDKGGSCCSAFREALQRNASVHIQAILHYSRDSAVTQATSAGNNSVSTRELRGKQSTLQRLKWMFPRLRTTDIANWEVAVVRASELGDDVICKEDFNAICARWRVYKVHDKEDLASSRALVRDASLLQCWLHPTLTKAEWIVDVFEKSDRRDQGGSSGSDDSPWPNTLNEEATEDTSTDVDTTDTEDTS